MFVVLILNYYQNNKMSIWRKFFEKKSTEAKSRGLAYMTSVFDSTIGKRRGGDDGFYKMIPVLMAVLIIGSVFVILIKGLIKYLPYLFGLLLVSIIILRKQIQAFARKKFNIGSIKENIPNPIPKLKQKLVDHQDNYAKGVVISARLEDISKIGSNIKELNKRSKKTNAGQPCEVVATIIIQKGILKIGDALKAHYSILGWHDCRVSCMYDVNGDKITTAQAGQTVSITGFYKLFSTKHIDIESKPINGKNFEAYLFENSSGSE
jgi:hypothetical protein